MFESLTKKILNDQPKIILSPHYDDFIFSIGGTALNWVAAKVTDVVIFSVSAYANGQIQTEPEAVERVSQLRWQEEMAALAEFKEPAVKLGEKREAPLRGYKNFTKFNYIKLLGEKSLTQDIENFIASVWHPGSQLFIPLGIGSHIDHLLVRNAAWQLVKNDKSMESYFYEDLPYAGNSGSDKISLFTKRNNLRSINIEIDLERKLKVVGHYSSQLTPEVLGGIAGRAKQIGSPGAAERIYCLS